MDKINPNPPEVKIPTPKEEYSANRGLLKGASVTLRQLIDPSQPDAQPAKEKPKVKFEIKNYIDKASGYAVQAFVPQSCNGSVDIYFSGDNHTNAQTMAEMDIASQAQAKWQRGNLSAFVVIEGDKRYLHRDQAKRYAALRKPDLFNQIIHGLEEQMKGPVKSIHLIGWSRGEEATRNTLASSGARNLINEVSLLDATYGNPQAFIDFAKNGGPDGKGGNVNIAYRTGTQTAPMAQLFERKMGNNPHANVVSTRGLSHGEVSYNYLEKFIDKNAPDITASPQAMVAAAPAAGPTQAKHGEQPTEKGDDDYTKLWAKQKVKLSGRFPSGLALGVHDKQEVNFRTEQGEKTGKLLVQGAQLTSLGEEIKVGPTRFIKVKYNGAVGFVAANFLEASAAPTVAANARPAEAKEVAEKEPFVKGLDHFGREVILRKGAMAAFERAKKNAEKLFVMVNGVKRQVQLYVNYSYRSKNDQIAVRKELQQKHNLSLAELNHRAAPPDSSPHTTGGALDIVAAVKGDDGKGIQLPMSTLAPIMKAAGFVQLPGKHEQHHWEYGTRLWSNAQKKGNKPAYVYQKELNLDTSKV